MPACNGYPMNHEAFSKITYGLYVIGSTHGTQNGGYVANTVFQVTSKPARMAIACHKDNHTCRLIAQSKAFSISVLRQEAKAELLGLFGYQSSRTIDKFGAMRYRKGQTGVPILLEDSLAWFECQVVQTVDVGSHLLFIGEVMNGDVIDSTQLPLTYAYYREVKQGKSPKNAPTYLDPSMIKAAKIESTSHTAAPSDKYICAVCGYVYDPAVGGPDAGMPPGTRFEDLPEDWVCPLCGAAKSEFVRQP